MTSYQAVRLFAEFLDHAGLEPGTVIGFTRNLLQHGLADHFFHPHDDHYHLVHHLLPNVPLSRELHTQENKSQENSQVGEIEWNTTHPRPRMINECVIDENMGPVA